MFLKKQLKKIVTGLTLDQEYVCLSREELTSPLKVILTLNDQPFQPDVTETHLFLGYRPVIIGLYGELGTDVYKGLSANEEITLNFVLHDLPANQGPPALNANKKSLARLALRKTNEKVLGTTSLFLFQAIHGEHRFLNYFHRF